jgi:hypothetical protein
MFRMPHLSAWHLHKLAVTERFALIHVYVVTEGQEEVTHDSELLAIVKKQLDGEVDWQGLLDMSMFSEDMDVGGDNDDSIKMYPQDL